jgi:hypothetical protein
MSPNQNTQISPQVYARICGVIYLVIIIAGIFGELFVRGKLVVPGNADATAHNILTHELLWRLGIAVDLFMQVCDIPSMLLFYILLKPVGKNIALLGVLFNLIQTAVLIANKLNLLAAWSLISGEGSLKSLQPQLLHALGNLFIQQHEQGFGLGLIYFGFSCLVSGYLIFKSGYFPKALGILLQIAGLCYIINSFALIVAPNFADSLFPFILLPSFIGELAVCLWLLIKGVNVTKWNERMDLNTVGYIN